MAERQRGASDTDLLARAAWLHFVGGLTQSEVAKRLDVPTTRAHRYIARAQNEGLVRIFVDVAATDCVALEADLMRTYGLAMCRVAMDVPEAGPMPLRTLSAVGATWLMQVIAARAHPVIGVGIGRTIAASVEAMGRTSAEGVRFVSLLGGLTRSGAANPYDVIHRLAQKTGAEAYLMPTPLFADTAADKAVMVGQAALAVTMGLIKDASLMVLGIGNLDAENSAPAQMLDATGELDALRARGARAEILGQFLDGEGRIVPAPHDGRVMALPLEALTGREAVAIAGGAAKTEAIEAALKSGLLTGLIIDEATARRLVERRRARPATAA
ncbi:MAG: sugar-binding domain-containing protein [Pseudomonadota bacterium]